MAVKYNIIQKNNGASLIYIYSQGKKNKYIILFYLYKANGTTQSKQNAHLQNYLCAYVRYVHVCVFA